MTIAEGVAIISALSALVAMFYAFKNGKKSDNKDVESRVAEMTKVNVKLDGISRDVSDVKTEIRLQRKELQDVVERLAKVEASASQAHKRIDRMDIGGISHER